MTVVLPDDPIGTTERSSPPPGPPARIFESFFQVEFAEMVALGVALTGDFQTAEDAAQEALSRAHRDWARVATLDKPGAWVRRVTINLLRSRGRRSAAERRALTRWMSRQPRDEIHLSHDSDEFWRLVRMLPERQAVAVTLHYLHDLSIADMAIAMECAEGTAKAHLHKARTSLASRLDKDL